MEKEKILNINSEELRDTVNRLKNCSEGSDILNETDDLIKKINEIYEKNGTKLDEETEKNKELNDSISDIKSSAKNIKTQAYDVLSQFLGVDLYKAENKRELKKAYSALGVLKKDIKVLEKVLNGDVVYNPPSLNNKDLIEYFSKISPKKKGLYFRDSEYKDINIMYKVQEKELENKLNLYEQEINSIDKKLIELRGSSDINSIRSLSKDKTNLLRSTDGLKRKIEDIYNDMNKYIIDHKIVENNILEYSTILSKGRNLYNNVELSLSIVGSDLSENGKTLERAVGSLKKVKGISEKFRPFINKYATDKKSRFSSLCEEIDDIINDETGDVTAESILKINRQLYNSSKSSMKAMRDTYFSKLGF